MTTRLGATLLAAAWLVAGNALAEKYQPTVGGGLFDMPSDTPALFVEGEVTMPALPGDDNLAELRVSAVTSNRFFVGLDSVSLGADNVIRYALVVTTPGGARNVSFEGMRCDARAWKLYATGQNGAWVPARGSDWKPIESKTVNRHHAALWRDYFCPPGGVVRNADDARAALRRGGHPAADIK